MSEATPEAHGQLTVVVPALNEAEALPSTLEELMAVCRPRNWEIIVVDDGSSDDTGAVAEAGGAKVIRHKVRRGYGGALKSGIRAANTTYVVSFDADGQHDPADLDALLEAAIETDADLVVGHRQGGSGKYRGLGKLLIRIITRILMPNSITDLVSGLKLARTDLARRSLALCPDSIAFTTVFTLVFLSNKHLVIERSVGARPRTHGESTVSTQSAFEVVYEVLNILTLFNPMKVFLPLAVTAWVAGVAWGVPIVLRGRGVSVGSMLAIVTGVVLFALGLLAEQLAAIRRQRVSGSDS